HDPATGLHLAGGLWQYWRLRGLQSEARAWLTDFLEWPGPADQARTTPLLGLGIGLFEVGDLQAARSALEQSHALAAARHDQKGVGLALMNLSLPVRFLGE